MPWQREAGPDEPSREPQSRQQAEAVPRYVPWRCRRQHTMWRSSTCARTCVSHGPYQYAVGSLAGRVSRRWFGATSQRPSRIVIVVEDDVLTPCLMASDAAGTTRTWNVLLPRTDVAVGGGPPETPSASDGSAACAGGTSGASGVSGAGARELPWVCTLAVVWPN
jgi:hypothetical protein